MSTPPSPLTFNTFALFPTLPPELRLKVWAHAANLFSRVVELRILQRDEFFDKSQVFRQCWSSQDEDKVMSHWKLMDEWERRKMKEEWNAETGGGVEVEVEERSERESMKGVWIDGEWVERKWVESAEWRETEEDINQEEQKADTKQQRGGEEAAIEQKVEKKHGIQEERDVNLEQAMAQSQRMFEEQKALEVGQVDELDADRHIRYPRKRELPLFYSPTPLPSILHCVNKESYKAALKVYKLSFPSSLPDTNNSHHARIWFNKCDSRVGI